MDQPLAVLQALATQPDLVDPVQPGSTDLTAD